MERWQVFGGSWGSTLALAYAQKHPERCHRTRSARHLHAAPLRARLVLSEGLARPRYSRISGSRIWPLSRSKSADSCASYYRRLTSYDRGGAAGRGQGLVHVGRRARVHATKPNYIGNRQRRIRAGVRAHRVPLLRATAASSMPTTSCCATCTRSATSPAVIVQGRYDVVCPMRSAWDLHRAWPEADLRIVSDAGHSALEPSISRELVLATDRFRDRVRVKSSARRPR